MEKNQLTSKDLLLTMLYCPGSTSKCNEPIAGRTRIMKMVFLFEKELYKQFFSDLVIDLPEFKPYNYGPFSDKVFEDLRIFESLEFITKANTKIPVSSAEIFEWSMEEDDDDDEGETPKKGAVEIEYSLSKKGVKFVEEKIWHNFSEAQRKNLINFKTQINTISLDSLLRYVYSKYPKDVEKSLIADKYI
ncbi:MAG: hypothetical protein WCY62_06665 [Clostridia bacterium]